MNRKKRWWRVISNNVKLATEEYVSWQQLSYYIGLPDSERLRRH